MSKIVAKLKQIKNCNSGNFAMMTALMVVPLFAILGGAVDISRAIQSRAVLQNATEAAALSAASLTNNEEVQTIIEEYIAANLPNNDMWDNLQINILQSDISLNSREIEIQASINVKSAFMHLAGVDEMSITTESTAVQKASKLEIAMVLDISSSMNGNRLSNLKTAATQFVDEIMVNNDNGLDVVSFNLIPYGGTVNIGNLFDDYVAPLTSSDVVLDPSKNDYNIGSDVLEEEFRFSDGLNCVEHPYEDYSDDLIPLQSRGQVPHFYRWWSTNPWCPTPESAVVMNTNDSDALVDYIEDLTLSDGTGTDIGLLWGVKSLSPNWQGKLGGDFSDRPSEYNDPDTMKIMVLMTDGGITAQFRPKKDHVDGLDDIKGSQQTIVSTGNYNKSSSHDSAYGRQKKLCEELDQNGVKVFTIGFQINASSHAAKQMEDCAVNGGNYYLVESLDISQAFQAISASISNLRVSG